MQLPHTYISVCESISQINLVLSRKRFILHAFHDSYGDERLLLLRDILVWVEINETTDRLCDENRSFAIGSMTHCQDFLTWIDQLSIFRLDGVPSF